MQSAKTLGIAGGLTGAILMLLLTLLAIMGIGMPLMGIIASLFPGYTVSFVGCIIGMVYGFFFGFILSYVHATVLSIVEAG